MKRLQDRVAIVTGAQQGLGEAVIREFAAEGAICIINHATEMEQPVAKKLATELTSAGTKAMTVEADVSDWDAVHAMVRRVLGAYGRVDILVNNAGVNSLRTWEDIDREIWDRTIAVNLTGVFNCCKAVLQPMKEQKRGNIINMASIAPYMGRGNVDYIASKNALLGMTRSLARQYGRNGIRANAIAPGFHDTDMVRAALGSKESAEEFISKVPLGFLPKPDSIGKAALYLASDDSYFVSGHTLVIDGGLMLR
jgi:3-oxoacyl-[acyl-carrier protein] reductase